MASCYLSGRPASVPAAAAAAPNIEPADGARPSEQLHHQCAVFLHADDCTAGQHRIALLLQSTLIMLSLCCNMPAMS